MDQPPNFPPPFIIQRVRALGFGTGPWQRSELVERWGAPMADKFIAGAKDAGWLVSPRRGVYFVPAASDVAVVSWLPPLIRDEFLISRTLASAGIPYWCMSAWYRDQGLDLGAPVFVTDLGTRKRLELGDARRIPSQAAVRDAARAVTADRSHVPELGSLLVVPLLGCMATADVSRVARVAEPPTIDARRRARTPEQPANVVQYVLGPEIVDREWLVALMISLGTARVEEVLREVLDEATHLDAARTQRWSGLLGPAQPVAGWRAAVLDATFPYLLVPDHLWAQMGADQAARRYLVFDALAEV